MEPRIKAIALINLGISLLLSLLISIFPNKFVQIIAIISLAIPVPIFNQWLAMLLLINIIPITSTIILIRLMFKERYASHFFKAISKTYQMSILIIPLAFTGINHMITHHIQSIFAPDVVKITSEEYIPFDPSSPEANLNNPEARLAGKLILQVQVTNPYQENFSGNLSINSDYGRHASKDSDPANPIMIPFKSQSHAW
jgi:hypothetical protein